MGKGEGGRGTTEEDTGERDRRLGRNRRCFLGPASIWGPILEPLNSILLPLLVPSGISCPFPDRVIDDAPNLKVVLRSSLKDELMPYASMPVCQYALCLYGT